LCTCCSTAPSLTSSSPIRTNATILFFPTGQINDTSIYLPDTPSSVGNKKPVHMLSTFHSTQELPSGRPKIVNNYNKNVGGVDTIDAIMKAYSGQRKNKRTLNLRKLLLQCIFLNFL
jgi:hypothetical protein